MSNGNNGNHGGSKRINLLEVKGGKLHIRHFDGQRTKGTVKVSRRTVRIGCFAMTKEALRSILPILQEATR